MYINYTAIISISYTTYRLYRRGGWQTMTDGTTAVYRGTDVAAGRQCRTALLRCTVGTSVATTVRSGVV